MAAAHGHTQSLHTNALDEAHGAADRLLRPDRAQHPALPAAGKRAPPGLIDPWGGSYYVERLTHDLAEQGLGAHRGSRRSSAAWRKRSMPAFPKMKIEEAAARTQARIDSGRQTDGRRQQAPRRQDEDARSIFSRSTTTAVRTAQIAKLEKLQRLREERDEAEVPDGQARRAHQMAPTPATATCSACAVDAARAMASVGEISDAMENGVRAPSRRTSNSRDHRGLSIGRGRRT